MDINFFQVIDILGTTSFAISGASMAIRKKLDIFGVLIIAFATSIGGGTMRDLLIGDTPVAWLKNEITIAVILVGTILTVIFDQKITRFSRTLFLFDSLGLGLFTMVGIDKCLQWGFSPGMCVALGTITACFGGVLRDVLLNNVPVIFQKEIYASACIAGGAVYFGARYLNLDDYLAQILGIALIVIIRIVVVKYRLSLPSFHKKTE